MSKDTLEFYRRWSLALFMPILAALIGYHSLTVKNQVLAEVEKRYAPKIELVTTRENLEKQLKALDVPALTSKVQNHESTLSAINANLVNLTELLKEVRKDVKDLSSRKPTP